MRNIFLAVALGSWTCSAQAQAPPPTSLWIGKTIIVKRAGVKLVARPEAELAPITDLYGIDYIVRDERDGWLKVTTSQGIPGWFERKDAIPMEEAVDHFSDVLRKEKNADVYACRSVAYRWMKEIDRAIDDISEAIRLEPKASAWWSNRAILWSDKGDLEQAIRDYDEALRLSPRNGIAHHGRANAYYARNEFEKAIKDYDEAIALDSGFLVGYLQRGNARYLKKDYDLAIKDYGAALQLDPRLEIAYHNRGNVWFAKKEFDRAIADYSETIRLLPSYAPAYNHRGASHSYKKEFDQALRDYEKALELDPRYASAWNGLAWLLATCPRDELRDGERALTAVRKALEISQTRRPKTQEIWAAVYAELGQFDRAVRAQEEAVADANHLRLYGEEIRQRLELYRKGRPYRDR